MPLSDDPISRKAQLANLRPGRAPEGNLRALRHGLRSRQPPPVVLDPLVREIEEALGLDLPLQAEGGGPPPADRYAVELAAIALLRVRRVSAYLSLHGDVDEKGRLRPELEGLGKAVEHAARMLDRLGCSPRARVALGLDVARAQSFDLAMEMSKLTDEDGSDA